MKSGGLRTAGEGEAPRSESLSQNLLQEAEMTFSSSTCIFRSTSGGGKNITVTLPLRCSRSPAECSRVTSACPLLPHDGGGRIF